MANQSISANLEENKRLHSELALISEDLDKLKVEKTLQIETITALKDQLDDLSVQWLDHTKLIQTLESENRYIKAGWDATKLEAVNYSLSRSWRLTRPMRKFIKFFKGK
jgi:predicted nuclease with TOPRIM domain